VSAIPRNALFSESHAHLGGADGHLTVIEDGLAVHATLLNALRPLKNPRLRLLFRGLTQSVIGAHRFLSLAYQIKKFARERSRCFDHRSVKPSMQLRISGVFQIGEIIREVVRAQIIRKSRPPSAILKVVQPAIPAASQ
jgi:hypothetical protein